MGLHCCVDWLHGSIATHCNAFALPCQSCPCVRHCCLIAARCMAHLPLCFLFCHFFLMAHGASATFFLSFHVWPRAWHIRLASWRHVKSAPSPACGQSRRSLMLPPTSLQTPPSIWQKVGSPIGVQLATVPFHGRLVDSVFRFSHGHPFMSDHCPRQTSAAAGKLLGCLSTCSSSVSGPFAICLSACLIVQCVCITLDYVAALYACA
jgi:hypothetical protein